MSYRIHQLPVEPAYTFQLTTRDEFAVVCGVNASGQYVPIMNCFSPPHYVPGGLLGIRWKGQLGDGGQHQEFQFAEQVNYIILITRSEMPPAFILLPPPPVVRVTSVTFQGYTPPRRGTVQKVWFLMFSNLESGNYMRPWTVPPCPVGTPFDDVEIAFTMHPYDPSVDGELQPTNPFDPNGPVGPGAGGSGIAQN